MPTTTIDIGKLIGKDLYTGASKVPVYSSVNPKTVAYYVEPKQFIGKIFSWVTSPTGGIYYMFYKTPKDYDDFKPHYVEHSPDKISVPQLPDILKDIQAEKEKKEKEEKGLLQYYLDKYLPVIALSVAGAFVLPSVISAVQNKKTSMSGTDKKGAALVLLLIIAAVVIAQQKKKNKPNKIIVDDPTPYGQGYNAPWTEGGYIDNPKQPIPWGGEFDTPAGWGGYKLIDTTMNYSLNGLYNNKRKTHLLL